MEPAHAFGLGGGFVILLALVAVAFALVATAFWIWMLISAIQNKGLDETEKIVWIIVIALTHWIGALIYFFIGHPKRLTPRSAPPTIGQRF